MSRVGSWDPRSSSYIHVNDLETNLLSKVATFADDTKLGGKVTCTEDGDRIQDALKKTNRLE